MITITPTSGSMLNVPGGGRMPMPPPNQRYPHAARNFFQPFRPFRPGGAGSVIFDPEFDGKRLRKSAMRKTVDYNASIIKMLEARIWQRDYRDHRTLQPDAMYIPDLMPPSHYEDNPINAVTTRFVKTATNKMRCPIFCMAWTPEGRRLVTGASSGEFTLWNGLTFNFETILQAHDTPVRTMVWSHNEMWMVTADHAGFVKYWQSNMNNVKMFMAHQEAIRGISFSPLDSKFASCSDDGTVKIWDFYRCQEERSLRGHGADVKCVHWHPQKGLIISGSKDNQQPVKLWDPKTGTSLATIHAHKSTVMDVKWNNNGNWFVTASRDHLLKLFDIRNLNVEVQVFRGHKKESSSVAWHPIHEGLFCSGGSDGAILFWHVGADKEVGAIEQAHDSIVWTLAWHPMGHILCSGSNDHTSKFWTRNRPGDTMRDKYNLNTLPASLSGVEEIESEDVVAIIPGMGPEDKVEIIDDAPQLPGLSAGAIPGLDDLDLAAEDKAKAQAKKVPYSKPIPKNFQANWNDTGKLDDIDDDSDGIDPVALINQLIEQQPGAVPLKELKDAEAIYIYGRTLTIRPGSNLAKAIAEGTDKMLRYIHSGAIRDMRDVIPYYENVDIGDTDEEESAIEHPMKEHDFGSLKELMDKQKEALNNVTPLPENTGNDNYDDDSHYRNDDSMSFEDDTRDDSWDDSVHEGPPSNRKGSFRNPAYRDSPQRDNWDRGSRGNHNNRGNSGRNNSGRDRGRGRLSNRGRHRGNDWGDNDKSNRRHSPHRDGGMMEQENPYLEEHSSYRDNSQFHHRPMHNEGPHEGFHDSPSNHLEDGTMGPNGPNGHNGPPKRDGPLLRDPNFNDGHQGQGRFPVFRGPPRGGQSAGGGFGGPPPMRNKFLGDAQMDSYGPRGGDSQGGGPDRGGGGMDNNSYYNDNDDWCDSDNKPPMMNKDNTYNNHYKDQTPRGGYRGGGRGYRGGRRNWRGRQHRGNHL